MLVKPMVIGEGGRVIERTLLPGDVMMSQDANGGAPFVVDDSGGAVTLTSAQFAQSVTPALEISGNAGALALNLPTADQIIAAIKGSVNVIVPPANSSYDGGHNAAVPMQWPSNLGGFEGGCSFRYVIRNLNSAAGTLTVTAQASSGVSVVGTATIAISKWREYNVMILASAPAVVVGCSTTNANKVLTTTDIETVKKVAPGMSVFGTNIGASAKVVAVDYNTGNITVDVNSTGTGGPFGITFTPTVVFTNLRAGDV